MKVKEKLNLLCCCRHTKFNFKILNGEGAGELRFETEDSFALKFQKIEEEKPRKPWLT
jgi:hypothetical protein